MPLVLVTSIQREIETTLPGRSPHATVHRRFAELVTAAGGTPVFAEPLADPAELAARVDAIVLNGGGDVEPARYNAERHPRTNWVEPERDAFEIALVREAVRRGLPLLGICRGLHVLNVALGGTLVQHLGDVTSDEHYAREDYARAVHAVALEPGSRLAAIYGAERLEVNSVHHQAVDRLGDRLRVAARAEDGTVEALEAEEGPVYALQWHPELLDPSHDPVQGRVFAAIVEAGAGR